MDEARALVREQGGDLGEYEDALWRVRDERSKEAPDFAMSTLDGVEHRLSDLRGKVVLLNFWHPT
jgi:hypothetical protein